MVKQQKKSNSKKRNSKGFKRNRAEARKINASMVYETCTEQLSPFGGLLALIKFFDLINFKEIFDSAYQKPRENPIVFPAQVVDDRIFSRTDPPD